MLRWLGVYIIMLVTFSGVNFAYAGNSILSDISFAVNEGERVALIGENGAGKTTLLKLITGALDPESGEIQKKNGATIGFLAPVSYTHLTLPTN